MHLALWHRQVLPVFFFLCVCVLLLLFVNFFLSTFLFLTKTRVTVTRQFKAKHERRRSTLGRVANRKRIERKAKNTHKKPSVASRRGSHYFLPHDVRTATQYHANITH